MKRRIKIILLTLLFSLFTSIAFSQSYAGDSDSMNYRGKRELRETGDFSVLNVSSARTSSSTVRFDILFNQAIDPNSVAGASFFVNGNRCNVVDKVEFSKDGKKIRVTLKVIDSSFYFEVRGINSYNGKSLSNTKVRTRDNGEVRLSSE